MRALQMLCAQLGLAAAPLVAAPIVAASLVAASLVAASLVAASLVAAPLAAASLVAASLIAAPLVAAPVAAGDDGFEPIFDGKSLQGWQGQDMSFWSVEDGAITGTIAPDHAPPMNQYLVWQVEPVRDFELKLSFRLTGSSTPATNGGFQFRSRRLPNGDVAGYQVDNNFAQPWKVRLYDEHGRHDLALEGERTVLEAAGRKRTEKLPLEAGALDFRLDEWHEYHLTARGPRLELRVNGKLVAEATDGDAECFEPAGILALQLHTGPPMRAQFKDIRIRRVKAAREPSARESLLASAALDWRLGDRLGAQQPPLKASDQVEAGLPAEGAGAQPGSRVARLRGGYFDAGADWNAPGSALTVLLRARVPDGNWTSALFSKRGGHDRVNFNLFSVDLGGTPGPDIGFEIHTDRGFFLASFPASLIAVAAWHDLAARYDGHRIQLLCDGKVMAEARAEGSLTQNAEPLLIGAETDAGKVVRPFTGEIEEAALWTRALTDDELAIAMRQPGIIAAAPAPEPSAGALVEGFRELQEVQRRDPHRPRWHFLCPEEGDVMPFDPNGAIFWKGRYHLFYIFQRRGGVHVWGHASSIDLLHWTHHPIGLDVAPGDPDRGIFSGNAFLDRDGVPTILYHGVGIGNSIAQSRDDLLERWQKSPRNPIVPIPKPGDPNHGKLESWDPHGWFERGSYYAVFGGKRPMLLKGPELAGLEVLRPMLDRDPWSGPDDDVSCPDFFPLGGRHVLLCISHRGGARCFTGRWEVDRFTPESHQWMNWPGGAFFAPETLLDGRGRRLLWAWVLDPRPNRAANGWSGVMSLPRVLSLGPDGVLGIEPAGELERLRLNPRSRSGVVLAADREVLLDDVSGNSLEISLEIDAGSAREIVLKVRRSPQGEEETAIIFDSRAGELRVDFSRSTLDASIRYRTWVIQQPADPAARDRQVTSQAAPFALRAGEPLRLRVFLDRSMLEVFANDRQCVTQRIFPAREDSLGVSIAARGAEARLAELHAWEMAAANAN